MYWERMTRDELNAADKGVPLVVSIAAVEQHGPHLATGTDAFIGNHFLAALEAARPAGVIVLPQVAVGCSEHHMDLGGTLTVSHATFTAYVMDVVGSALRHGFRNVLILNSHGGNQAVGGTIAQMLAQDHPDCRIVFTTWWQLAGARLRELVEGGRGAVGHACEFETSLLMAAEPDAVRDALIPARGDAPTFPWAEGDMLNGAAALWVRPMSALTGGTGVRGAPALANAPKGTAITTAVVTRLVEIVDDLQKDVPESE
ncbi:creatininase family protein [Acuticoccus sp. I52.16.1]|uniref:creatininase family protein n=1 Tax=Acuticoccus sp. I52.16.1 TaxID=2928472 RepID=UPI001FD148AE|nr:creatininase family protein [Acuticoccus sp. I52.16.1]UOM35115.1 creatininase family protein [Acuticoccus sp. I52.16.1]